MSVMAIEVSQGNMIAQLQNEVSAEIRRRRAKNGMSRSSLEAMFHTELSRATEDFSQYRILGRALNAAV